MATGWAGDGAVQDQIDATVKDAIQRARSQLPSGPGRRDCEECGEAIPEARRQALPRPAIPGRGRAAVARSAPAHRRP